MAAGEIDHMLLTYKRGQITVAANVFNCDHLGWVLSAKPKLCFPFFSFFFFNLFKIPLRQVGVNPQLAEEIHVVEVD